MGEEAIQELMMIIGRLKQLVYLRKSPNPILVYSRGFSGANSLAVTLSSSIGIGSSGAAVPLAHILGKESYRDMLEISSIVTMRNVSLRERINTYRVYFFRYKIKKCKYPVRLISSVRDPMAQIWSAFVRTNQSYIEMGADRDIYSSFDSIVYRINDAITQWFERIYAKETGIDVFAFPFNKEDGYGLVRGEGKITGLIIKSENAKISGKADTLSKAIGEFVDCETLKIQAETSVDARNLAYYERYQELMANYEAPPDILDSIYSSRYMRHFYTDEEIAAFRKKWGAKADSHATPV